MRLSLFTGARQIPTEQLQKDFLKDICKALDRRLKNNQLNLLVAANWKMELK